MSTAPAFDDVSLCSTCMPKLTTYGHIIGVYYDEEAKENNLYASFLLSLAQLSAKTWIRVIFDDQWAYAR